MEKPKFFVVVEWVIVIVLMGLFASDMIGLPENNDQHAELYTSFQMPRPVIHRVLVPLLARGVMLFGVPADWSIAIVLFTSGLLAWLYMRRLFEYYGMERLALLSFLLTYILVTYKFATPQDFMSVFLFCLSYWLMVNNKFDTYVYLFPIIAMHRETSVLLIGLYFLYRFPITKDKTWGRGAFWDGLFSQVISFVVVRLAIMTLPPNAAGGQSVTFLTYDTMGVYLRTPAMLSALLILAGIFFIAYSYWDRYWRFLRAGFVLFPVQIVLHLLIGNPFELRVMAESFPIVLLIVFIPMFRTHHPASSAESSQTERGQIASPFPGPAP